MGILVYNGQLITFVRQQVTDLSTFQSSVSPRIYLFLAGVERPLKQHQDHVSLTLQRALSMVRNTDHSVQIKHGGGGLLLMAFVTGM